MPLGVRRGDEVVESAGDVFGGLDSSDDDSLDDCQSTGMFVGEGLEARRGVDFVDVVSVVAGGLKRRLLVTSCRWEHG